MNPKQIEEFFHLSPVQKHLLRQSEMSADANSYLAQFGCYLNGSLDVSAFERAWQKITNRQPGLRMTFISGDLKEPVQVVNRNVGVDLEKQDWRNLAAEDQTRRWNELLLADRQCGVVLKTPPLWRMTLVRLTETQYYFLWTYHELLFDEQSLPLVFNEALTAYAAIQQGKNETLPLPTPFRKYVEWSKKKDPHEAENFWRAYLDGISAPTAIEVNANDTSVHLDVLTMDRLKVLAADAQVSSDVIVQGAWALVLSHLSGQADVLFGSTVAGRPAELHAADRSIGHFSNILPLRVKIPTDAAVAEYLASLSAQQTQWRQYEYNSLTQIQGWSAFPPDQPLFQSALVFDSAVLETSLRKAIAGLEIVPERLVLPNDFPLTVMVKEAADGWHITSNDACAEHLGLVLEQFARDSQQPLRKIQGTVPASPEQHAPAPEPVLPDVPAEWTSQPTDDEQGWVAWIKGESCVHELFEERAAKTPEAIAVRCNNVAMTYRELNERANQLARYLHKLNVLPAIPVGLCLPGSLEAVIGLLGVLKAGGAYLPLEPTLTTADLQHILQDTAGSLLITQARLEPQFRAIPLTHIVLCLDTDWPIIAEEERTNPAFQIGDEHPACFLVERYATTIITHARLAQAVLASHNQSNDASAWFHFEPGNPWHLLSPAPPAAPAKMEIASFEMTPTSPWELSPSSDWETENLLEVNLTAPLESAIAEPLEVEMPSPATISAPTPPATLAPIQQWFFAQHPLEPQHWNISLLVEIGDQLDRATLEQALQLVVAQHEALRWRFAQTEAGWQLSESATSKEEASPFEYVDFSAKWARSQRRAIEEAADKLQTSLNLSTGPLWRMAYFDLGVSRAHRLLVIFHHLIGDAASLRIFMADVLESYWHIRRNQRPPSLPKTASYRQWLQANAALADDNALAYWQKTLSHSFSALPTDHPDGANTYGQMDRVLVSLNSAETESLLQHVLRAANATLNELVTTALALALAQWTNDEHVLLELERNARQSTVADLDVAHTLGWFTARFPVALEISQREDVVAALHAVQAQLRAVPDNGFRYGWLRYASNTETQSALSALPAPQISFTYLDFAAEKTDWQMASENVGTEQHPHNKRSTVIAVTGALNLNMLEFQWSYARAQFEQRTIGVLVNSFIAELRRLIQTYSQHNARGGD